MFMARSDINTYTDQLDKGCQAGLLCRNQDGSGLATHTNWFRTNGEVVHLRVFMQKPIS